MKKTKLGGTVAMFVLALGATGAMAHGGDVKSHDPRMAVAMEEVVLVSKTGPLAGGSGGSSGCGFVSNILGNVAGNLLGNTTGTLLGIIGNVFGGGASGNCN
ncbi:MULTISPECIES: hypothetical protein [Corallococcus]|uniref:Secreted protein n=2 Tax=Corallococcus TaxID=83461 RepID=A0A7Y4NI56_9BACT|nr:hypothetical protein [Corallococcus exercitus]NOK13795.1 hypothetical protein [Corallococcus exercitus]GMU04379.1 hypothetical protein ASNO1_06310 [Corallococcus sp. NO1]